MLSSNLKSLHQLLNYSFFLSTYWLLIEFSLSAIPVPPQSIEARAPWFGQLTIEWIDDSIDEESYALEYRTDPESEWITLSTLSPTSRSSNLSGGSPGQKYEFRILSINGDGITSSPTSIATMPDAFLNPAFVNIKYGQPFEFELKANNLSNSENITYSASPLPKGLFIDPLTGTITGTPEEDGFFDVILKAEYDLPGSIASIAKLALRIPPQLSPPILIKTIPEQKVSITQESILLDLNNYFSDPDTKEAIKITTNKGVMFFSLFEKATPLPVQNFLNYVRNETYKNNIFHRSVTNGSMSIIQSGSFSLSENQLTSNLTVSPIINEPGIANEKGTLAYARTSNPDSATSGWYINSKDSPGLDVGESYTVFGRASLGSLSVIDIIQNIPTGSHNIQINDRNNILNDFPTTDGLAPNLLTKENIVSVENIVSINSLNHNIISVSDARIASIKKSNENGKENIIIEPLRLGSTSVIIRSIDIDGNYIDTQFKVSILISFKEWASKNQITAEHQPAIYSYAFGIKKGLPRSPEIIESSDSNPSAISFYHRRFSSDLHYTVQCSHNLNTWKDIWISEDGKESENVIDYKEDEEFAKITIKNNEQDQLTSNLFYRILVHYSDQN